LLLVLTGLLTVYTAGDMYMINRRRKAEFATKLKQVEADSLEAARIAYMTNTATEEQVALVEEINRRARAADEGFKLPSLLGPPTAFQNKDANSASKAAGARFEGVAAAPALSHESANPPKVAKNGGWRSWFSSSLSKSEEGEWVGTSRRRLGYESLSGEDDGVGVRESDTLRAIDEKQQYMREKAQQALAQEKENQRTGGPLDRAGLETKANTASSDGNPGKRSWW
jgi:hypothetical protein